MPLSPYSIYSFTSLFLSLSFISLSFNCSFCLIGESMNSSNSFELGCSPDGDGSHRFCLLCWQNWCNAEADKGPSSLSICCAGFKCNEKIPSDTMLRLLDPKKRNLFSHYILMNFVQCKSELQLCVNSRCDKVVRYEHHHGIANGVKCSCQQQFCFQCALPEIHSPAPCDMVKLWMEKSRSDAENQQWLLAHTKSCPSCKLPIEKNSGCNHMVIYNNPSINIQIFIFTSMGDVLFKTHFLISFFIFAFLSLFLSCVFLLDMQILLSSVLLVMFTRLERARCIKWRFLHL